MTTDATAGLEALERELKEATARRDELIQQARAAHTRAREIGDQLAKRAAEAPTEFDATSNPRPRTEAAKLAGEARSLLEPAVSWERRIADSELAIRAAKGDRARFVVENVKPLAKALEPKAHAAVARIEAGLAEIDAAIIGHARIAEAFTALMAPVPGLDPRTELPPGEALHRLRREAHRMMGEIPLPVPRSLIPVDGRAPIRVETPDGGWIGVGQAPAEVAA